YRIGVPLPIAGVTHKTSEGYVRKVEMGKSIHFDQVATDWRENRYVRWAYRFDKDSFPPGALDDHVMIGGHYFDLLDTVYRLTPKGVNTTELSITMHYRVSTQFNWYADGVARALIGNFEQVILEFYRRRAVAGH
ncbi:MAG TPA: SRPBCC domain-containing protein, partial [Burkholderiaceae bacterium]